MAGSLSDAHPAATGAHSATSHSRVHANWRHRFIIECLPDSYFTIYLTSIKVPRVLATWDVFAPNAVAKKQQEGNGRDDCLDSEDDVGRSASRKQRVCGRMANDETPNDEGMTNEVQRTLYEDQRMKRTAGEFIPARSASKCVSGLTRWRFVLVFG